MNTKAPTGSKFNSSTPAPSPSIRRITYAVLAFGLILLLPLLNTQLQWQADGDLHTILEVIATLLAFVVGALAMVEYQSKGRIAALFVACGFLGTGLLEAYHMVTTASYFLPPPSAGGPSLTPASWVSECVYLGIMLCCAAYFSYREQQTGEGKLISARQTYGLAALLALAFLVLPHLLRPSSNYWDFLIFHRPGELVAAIPLAAALGGFYWLGYWRSSHFHHWLILSLLLLVTAQLAVLPFSQAPFDLAFNVGHLLKNLSYLLVFIGLLHNIHASFTAVHREIRERKNAERALRFAEIRKSSIISTMVDGLIVINEDGVVEDFNPSAERIFGYSADEVIGNNVTLLMPAELASEHSHHLRRYRETGEKRMLAIGGRETEGLRKDGSRFPISLAVAEMQLGGKTKFSGIIRDISERKEYEARLEQRREELEATNAELEKFAYIASHDLQEPLRKISAFGSRLKDKYAPVLDEAGQDYLARMIAASERMSTLINDLLSFSRLSTKSQTFRTHDLCTTVDEVLSDLELIISKTQAQIEVSELPRIYCDPSQIRQLFQNLLGNSLKFHRPDVAPVIQITAQKIGQFKGSDGMLRPWCRFEVKDNGIGFSSQYYDKVFQIFQRLHSRQQYEGTGIGLAICRKVVELHGGNISVQSSEGEGTTFTFTLPLAVDQSQATDPRAAA